jgi:hypothetical protein
MKTRLFAVVIFAIVLMAISTKAQAEPCAINSFVATTSTYAAGGVSITITEGDTASLLYQVTGGCESPVYIDPQKVDTSYPEQGIGGTLVSPIQTTVYTLKACDNSNTCTTATVTVTVEPVCLINDFYGTTKPLQAGASAQISWNTSNCSSLSIQEFTTDGKTLLRDLGSVTPINQGSLTVQPDTTVAEYVLTATDGIHPNKTATATVGYNPTCVMASLTANPATVIVGGKSTITWTATGTACNDYFYAAPSDPAVATSAIANPYCPDTKNPCTGTITVTPATTTSFLVGVESNPTDVRGIVTEYITVTVRPIGLQEFPIRDRGPRR